MRTSIVCALLCESIAFSGTFTITPSTPFVAPGQKITFSTTLTATAVDWSISADVPAAAVTGNGTTMDYTVPAGTKACTPINISATKPPVAASGSTPAVPAETETLTLAVRIATGPGEPCPGGNISFGIIGLEQSGGTSAKSTQRLFIDIFDSRPLPFWNNNTARADIFGPAMRWWGTVRVASYPQQISSPVSSLDIAGMVGKLPVNQIAGYGEFRAGLERRLKGFDGFFLPAPGGNFERTSIGLIGYFGGAASLNAPPEEAQVYTKPDPTTPQGQAFNALFPVSQYPILTNAKYVGLTAPDHKSFYWQYAAGFRMTTRFFDSSGTLLPAPAMFSASFGQNELVTGGRRRGVVAVIEGFLPLSLSKNADWIYLFGRVDLHLGRANLGTTPLALQPAVDSSGNAIPVTNPGVGIIAVPSNRDLYSIGVGLDAIGVINTIFPKKAAAAATTQK